MPLTTKQLFMDAWRRGTLAHIGVHLEEYYYDPGNTTNDRARAFRNAAKIGKLIAPDISSIWARTSTPLVPEMQPNDISPQYPASISGTASPQAQAFLHKRKIDTLIISGYTAYQCVPYTAKVAANNNRTAIMAYEATDLPEKYYASPSTFGPWRDINTPHFASMAELEDWTNQLRL